MCGRSSQNREEEYEIYKRTLQNCEEEYEIYKRTLQNREVEYEMCEWCCRTARWNMRWAEGRYGTAGRVAI